MKRHAILILPAAGAMIAIAALSPRNLPRLLVLEWAAKAAAETPPVAVLIELGLKDQTPTPWAGSAKVTGARIVHREGYRFRTGDRLIDPGGWQASSHRPLRLPPRRPDLTLLEGIASVGIVLHLADVKPDAELILDTRGNTFEQAVIPLKDVLAGQTKLVWGGTAAVRRISTATPVVTAKTEDDFPAAAYGPDGTLWLAYISYTVRDERRRIEQGVLTEQPADFKAFYTPEFADQLFVKYYRDGKWSEPVAVTGSKEDLVRCAIAADKDGSITVLYGANRSGRYSVYKRTISGLSKGATDGQAQLKLGKELKEDDVGPAPAIIPVACTNQSGKVNYSYQDAEWMGQKGELPLHIMWHAAIAAGPNGEVAGAYDIYDRGDYDVAVGIKGRSDLPMTIAGSSRFEARPSLCYDPQDRLWIAYEEGPEKWGKDYGALDAEDGNPLYNVRSVRVVCFDKGKLFKPAADLPTSARQGHHPDEKTPRYAYPKVGIDGKGRLWLTYRQKFGSRYSTHPGSYWLTFARRLDGDKWTEPMEIHHSDGLLDSRPVLLPHASGGLLVVHNTDGRYTTPEIIDNQIYMSYVDLPGQPIEPKLLPHDPGKKDPKLIKELEEGGGVGRIRNYQVEVAGKKYRLLRGEFHRHTEMSWDGGPDGSLEDMFRYAIDAADLDWIGNTDHDNGDGREYSWWLTQKLTDAYHVPNAFTPMFAYERSVNYPDGHRNCVFAKRGIRTLPRLVEVDRERRLVSMHRDDTKMLYRYLHELDGICAVHTSATDMGTDWRDNDPQVEPVVEIYQGDRNSYEYQEAPRAGHDPKSRKQPISIGGWEPAGFIDLALKKGYRLGFESSSDHWSTHISYTVVLAERNDRAAILDALKKRHCYAATDDIIADVRSGGHLMGDEFRSTEAPALQFTFVGTKALAGIDILKDSEVVATIKPGKQEYRGSWTDPQPEAGVHYYYIRAQQTDGELAWTSPLWIEYVKRE